MHIFHAHSSNDAHRLQSPAERTLTQYKTNSSSDIKDGVFRFPWKSSAVAVDGSHTKPHDDDDDDDTQRYCTGSHAMGMANPSTLTTMDGCTGSTIRSQMADTPTQIYGQIYPNTPHPSCIPHQASRTKMTNRCSSSPRATPRR